MAKDLMRMRSQPVRVPRTRRNHNLTVLTSFGPGKSVPVAAVPLFREDDARGAHSVMCEMMETVEILMNPVHLRLSWYLVPWLAFDRFEGSMDQFNRSYVGEPQIDGGDVTPFFETMSAGAHMSIPIHKALGYHAAADATINTMFIEAYNAIYNYRAKNRSPSISQRARLETTLAPAFWNHAQFAHLVPDFDEAVMDGQVALNVVESQLPVRGIGARTRTYAASNETVYETGDTTSVTYPHSKSIDAAGGNNTILFAKGSAATNGVLEIYAEMQENGITVSLATIEQARKTQAFANLRKQFNAHDDDWIIDMLMSGLQIPDQALKNPMLLSRTEVPFGMAKRHATSEGALTESVVSGMAAIRNMRVRVPRLPTGGVMMCIAEVIPEQLFERQKNPFLFINDVDDLPEFVRDTLDEQKVDYVYNGDIDTSHSTPNGVFAYEPLNGKYTRFGACVGGKFARPVTNTSSDTFRQRLYAVETVDPVLAESFYVVNNIHVKPFVDQVNDQFEMVIKGNVVIGGNTVFGPKLIESTGESDYDVIAGKAPTEQIETEA